MSTGNQTLLLSGSLLSNAATELAQTLRVDLLQLLEQSVKNLTRFGLTEKCTAILEADGFLVVQDLNFLQVSHLRTMGFPLTEIPLLTEICNEVRRTISVGSLSKILKNASDNITEIAANLPIKNTFIDFPTLFSQQAVVPERTLHSCPAFLLDDERKAIAELEASLNQQRSPLALNRRPEPSRGAADHGTGNCKPCAWFHHAEGCRHGTDCEFCHMCPAGEIKKRKKDKQKILRSLKGPSDPLATPEHESDDTGMEAVYGSSMCHPVANVPTRSTLSSWLGSVFAK